jgi:hypothetical protein
MYSSVDFSSEIVAWRGSIVPQTRGSLGRDLNLKLLLLVVVIVK